MPHLGLQSSSSSDSGTSIFQEGRQTVRHLGAGTEFKGNGRGKLNSSLDFENLSNVLIGPESKNTASSLRLEHYDTENRHENKNSTSLPDLPTEFHVKKQAEYTERKGTIADDKRYQLNSEFKSYKPETAWHWKEKPNHPVNVAHMTGDPENVPSLFSKYVYKASEIIQTSDHSDEEGRDTEGLKEQQMDQEIASILEQLRKVCIVTYF